MKGLLEREAHSAVSFERESIENLKKFQDSSYLIMNYAETKLLIPSPPHKLVGRPKLLQKLDEILKKKLTVISAPAGFGKTTLISKWAVEKCRDVNISWISLSETDNRASTFWFYIVLSLKMHLGHNAWHVISALENDNQYSIENVSNYLINTLNRLNQELVLILDDYHLISDYNLNKSMAYFLSNLPANMHVVMVTRTKPELALSRLRVRDEILELKVDELRFNSMEISELLTKLLDLNLSEDEVHCIENLAEGWIAALRIIAVSIAKSNDYRSLIFKSNCCNEYMLEYLSEEIINQIPANIKEFLYKTSVLPVLNSSICNFILDIDYAQEVLECLIEKNLFIVVLDENRCYLRYHHLFLEFLNNRLHKYYHNEVEEIYIRASRWYEEYGYFQEAIDFSIKAGDHNNSARLIEIYVGKIAVRGEFQKIIHITETLPNNLIESKPRICIYYAVALALSGKLDEEQSYLKKRGIDLDSDFFNSHRALIYGIKSIAALYGSSIDKQLVKVNAEKALSTIMNDDFLGLLLRAIVYSNLGNLMALEGNFDQALENFETAFYYADKSENLFVRLTVTHKTAQAYYNQGKLNLALGLYENTINILQQDESLLYPSVNMIYLGISTIYYELNETEKAYKYAEKSMSLSKARNDSIKLLQSYILLAKIYAVQGKAHDTVALIKEIDRMVCSPQLEFILKQYISDIVRLLLHVEEISLVRQFMDKYNFCDIEALVFDNEDQYIACAELSIFDKAYSDASLILEKLLLVARNERRQWSIIRILMLSAVVSKHSDNKKQAVKHAGEAIKLAEQYGYFRTLIDYGKNAGDLIDHVLKSLEEAPQWDALRRYCRKLLTAFNNTTIKETAEGVDGFDNVIFSPREQEVLACILEGSSNVEISEKLFISLSTVKKHTKNILVKLNVKSRAKAIAAVKKLDVVRKHKQG